MLVDKLAGATPPAQVIQGMAGDGEKGSKEAQDEDNSSQTARVSSKTEEPERRRARESSASETDYQVSQLQHYSRYEVGHVPSMQRAAQICT